MSRPAILLPLPRRTPKAAAALALAAALAFLEPPWLEAGAAEPAQLDAPAAESKPPGGRLEVDVTEAILMAVENNQALKVERLNPDITQTFEGEQRAIFDPVVGFDATTNASRTRSRGGDGQLHSSTGAHTSLGAWIEDFLPTGTTLTFGADYSLSGSGTWYHDRFETTRVGLSVTQALLRGCGVSVNLASLRQARLDTLASNYELRGFAETLVADVEQAYWDCALAERQIEIYAASAKVAEDQLSETVERIKIGKLAESVLAIAQAEVASRHEALINARSAYATALLRFLRLLNPSGPNLWSRQAVLKVHPAAPALLLDDVEAHVRLALRLRPDLNEARLRVRRGELELVKTRNGLLPKLDLFAALGKSGYATALGRSPSDLSGKGYDASVGITFEFPLGNRAATARNDRAAITARQLAESLTNLEQLAQLDVRMAYIEVQRSREQVVASAATRKAREVAAATEAARLREGKSTPFLVAIAQRDLLASQITEVEAVVSLLKGLVDLHRAEGSVLERRGIAAPGRESLAP